MKILILNTEFDVDFTDADIIQKIDEAEKIVQQQSIELMKIYDTLPKAEGIRQECKIAKDFLDYVLGEGTSEKLFGNKNSLDTCVKAIEDLKIAKEEQESRFNSIISKYSPERLER